MRSIELTDMNASMEVATSIPLGTFPAGMNVPVPTGSSSPLEYAESVGGSYLSFSRHQHRKNGGHYLAPATIASFMAGHSSYSGPHMRVLDPGSGTGMV